MTYFGCRRTCLRHRWQSTCQKTIRLREKPTLALYILKMPFIHLLLHYLSKSSTPLMWFWRSKTTKILKRFIYFKNASSTISSFAFMASAASEEKVHLVYDPNSFWAGGAYQRGVSFTSGSAQECDNRKKWWSWITEPEINASSNHRTMEGESMICDRNG